MDPMFDDVSALQTAASNMAQHAESIRSGISPIAKQMVAAGPMPGTPPAGVVQANAIPDAVPLKTEEQIAMEKYNEEKNKLFSIQQQLVNLATADKSGEVIRNFGMSQLVIKVGDMIDRTNGLILLRALKVKNSTKKRERNSKDKESITEVLEASESVVTNLYEVWSMMEDGSIGLTACYDTSVVLFVVNLKSGFDMPPEE
jgi:hypothetical protein